MKESDIARAWRRVNVFDASRLSTRWRQRSEGFDPLAEDDRFRSRDAHEVGDTDFVWLVREEYELDRLIGALRFYNPKCSFWFRGEGGFHTYARPGRYRCPGHAAVTNCALRRLVKEGLGRRLFRDRTRLAQLAILQHYGIPTSFLDVTKDYRIAAFFALYEVTEPQSPREPPEIRPNEMPHILIFAAPRSSDSIAYFHEAGVTIVDLAAEMPSLCLRPHVQEAGFIGRNLAVSLDVVGEEIGEEGDADLNALCIARLKLEFPKSLRDRFFRPPELLFPPAPRTCAFDRCRSGEVTGKDDWRFDLALHGLYCIDFSGEFEKFPNFHWYRD